MPYQPIGVFDSGYGGLTVLKEVVQKLPRYDYLYLGDNARAPYGDKDFETVYRYTLQCVEWFFSQGCHLVILACNTASAKALRTIQQIDLPRIAPHRRVLGVIRPTSEVIGNYTRSGHVGVLGTRGTVRSESYLIEIKKTFPELVVTQEACPSWVPIVESGAFHSPAADAPVRDHITHIMAEDGKIDTLLLACTHYPLLMPKMKQYLPPTVEIVSQGEIVANSLADYLTRHPAMEKSISKGGSMRFFTTGPAADFENHTTDFFGRRVHVSHVDLV